MTVGLSLGRMFTVTIDIILNNVGVDITWNQESINDPRHNLDI